MAVQSTPTRAILVERPRHPDRQPRQRRRADVEHRLRDRALDQARTLEAWTLEASARIPGYVLNGESRMKFTGRVNDFNAYGSSLDLAEDDVDNLAGRAAQLQERDVRAVALRLPGPPETAVSGC
jgi:hypothetical protein